MPSKSVRGLMIFGVMIVTAAFAMTLFLGDASGDVLEIFRLGEAGVKLGGLAFIPLALYLLWKAA